MVARCLLACCLIGIWVAFLSGCGKPKSTKSTQTEVPTATDPNKPFLEASRDIPSKLEWNRDIVSAKGGTVRYVITSEGLFSISVVTDEAYQILTGKKPGKPEKKDLLLTLDSKGNSYEGTINLPPGRCWFIIENRTDRNVMMTIKCYAK